MNVFEHLAETNSWEYNHLKAIEELSELTEVLIKRVTKKGGPKEPKKQEVIDEIGDVIIRLEVLSKLYGNAAVGERTIAKLTKMEGYINENKYTGSI